MPKSTMPRDRCSVTSSELSLRNLKRMLGCVHESRLAIRAIASVACVSLQAMLTSPPAMSGVLSSVSVLSSRSESSRARLRSRCPALVREMPWPPRSSSLQPSSFSSLMIWRESAGWLMCSSSAARVMLPVWATAIKVRSSLMSIRSPCYNACECLAMQYRSLLYRAARDTLKWPMGARLLGIGADRSDFLRGRITDARRRLA